MPNILYVVHDQGMFAGTQLYVRKLAETMAEHHQVWILSLTGDVRKFKTGATGWEFFDVTNDRSQTAEFGSYLSVWDVAEPSRAEKFTDFLRREKIQIVHFFHLLGFPLELPALAADAGCKTVFSLVDYYLVCHRLHLLNDRGVFCKPNEIPLTECDRCLSVNYDLLAGSQSNRRSLIAQTIPQFDCLLFLTEYQRQMHRHFYDLHNNESRIFPMGMPSFQSTEFKLSSASEPLKIAVPGVFCQAKGSDVVLAVLEYFRLDARFSFTVMGQSAEPFLASRYPNVTLLNGYRPQESMPILAEHHVALLLSVVPETWGFALSESMAAGTAPIVSDIGAYSERVNADLGWIVPPDDAQAVIAILERLVTAREELEALRSNCRSLPNPTTADDGLTYANIYGELLQSTDKVSDSRCDKALANGTWARLTKYQYCRVLFFKMKAYVKGVIRRIAA